MIRRGRVKVALNFWRGRVSRASRLVCIRCLEAVSGVSGVIVSGRTRNWFVMAGADFHG